MSGSSGHHGASGPRESSGSPDTSTFRDDPEYVRLRRQIIRDNHPDRGGSDEALITALAELDVRWQRRTRPGYAASDIHLPGFIPEDIARQATELAEQYADEILRRAADLQADFQTRARRVVDAQTPRLRQARKSAGRAASSVVRTVQEHLPQTFPGARRYTDTRTTRTEKQ